MTSQMLTRTHSECKPPPRLTIYSAHFG